MALNDRFQLTNYGSEVQQAIDNALIYLPEEVALKAYRDEVLTKNQTIAYTPVGPYNPATKLYVDEANDTTNQRLDDEIARATAAEKNLNEKHVLTWDDNSYKYLNLADINSETQALVDENALDQKLAELSLGFFVFYQVKEDGTLVEASKDDSGSNPYSVVATSADLPTTDVPADALALVLKDDENIEVYKYDGTSWSVLATPVIENGWLFAEESTGHGFYWFQNTWNKVDMNVDMSEYYKKTEIDSILGGYVTNTTLGALTDLTTSDKTTIVAAINSLQTLTDTKDTLPTIPARSLIVTKGTSGKPKNYLNYATDTSVESIAQRTTTGTLKAADATADDDLTTLKQVQTLISEMDISGYQPLIAAGTANDIIAYSGTAGTLNSLGRLTTINATLASTSDTKIPTEKATATYVQNYKPVIITQGSSNTNVTTSQLTFWIES